MRKSEKRSATTDLVVQQPRRPSTPANLPKPLCLSPPSWVGVRVRARVRVSVGARVRVGVRVRVGARVRGALLEPTEGQRLAHVGCRVVVACEHARLVRGWGRG